MGNGIFLNQRKFAVSYFYYNQMLQNLINKSLIFFNRFILMKSKQATSQIVGKVDLVLAFFKHKYYFKHNRFAKLVYANGIAKVPLPNRWTNDDQKKSEQPVHLIAMQAQYSSIPTSFEKQAKINRATDKSWATIQAMDSSYYTMKEDFYTLNKIRELYDPQTDTSYNLQKQVVTGESIVNGENPFALRKFNGQGITYDLPQSKTIEFKYKQAIRAAFSQNTLNHSALEKAGISKEELIKQFKQDGQKIYSMFFEYLQFVTQGNPLKNTPEIFFENQTLRDTYVLQAPYPIFLKAKKEKNEGYICIGVAYRYNGGNQIKVFSPFFNNQSYNLWKLAQAQLLQGYFNDFHVRVHLGLLHMTTNQYNVPLYNSLRRLSPATVQYKNLKIFYDLSFTMFNQGLEGVNLAAVTVLMNPDPSYSVINKVFNLSQKNAYRAIAEYSNRVDLSQINPQGLLKRSNIPIDQASRQFDQIALAIKLNSIVAQYIKQTYQVLKIGNSSKSLLADIKQQIPKMCMGGSKLERIHPKSQGQLLAYFQNLAYCWMCFHAHTFTVVPYAQYFSFRPSMLSKSVPNNQSEWNNVVVNQELPHPKVMMSSNQLVGSVCAKDPNNFIIDKLKRKLMAVSYSAITTNDQEEKGKYEELEKIINRAISSLNAFEQELATLNESRFNKNQPRITWYNPKFMEASLNI